MKKTIVLAGIVLLAIQGAWAAQVTPSAQALGEIPELTADELAQFDGEALYLGMDRVGQTMTVTSIVPGDYSKIECYTVKATTNVVRNTDVSQSLPKTAYTNTNKTIKASNGQNYNPTQLNSGTYNLGTTKTNVGGMGAGIKIEATQVVQTTSGKNAVSSDFFVHATPYSNTNGCVGVMGKGMSKIMSTYSNAVGPKTLSIFGRY